MLLPQSLLRHMHWFAVVFYCEQWNQLIGVSDQHWWIAQKINVIPGLGVGMLTTGSGIYHYFVRFFFFVYLLVNNAKRKQCTFVSGAWTMHTAGNSDGCQSATCVTHERARCVQFGLTETLDAPNSIYGLQPFFFLHLFKNSVSFKNNCCQGSKHS